MKTENKLFLFSFIAFLGVLGFPDFASAQVKNPVTIKRKAPQPSDDRGSVIDLFDAAIGEGNSTGSSAKIKVILERNKDQGGKGSDAGDGIKALSKKGKPTSPNGKATILINPGPAVSAPTAPVIE